MSAHSSYLAAEIRGRILAPIAMYREIIFREVFSVFSNLESRANRIAGEYYNQRANEPVLEYESGDLADVAESAQVEGSAFYQTMIQVRQTMLNLLATGLFHLSEQQLAESCRDTSLYINPPAETKLDTVAKWYQKYFDLDIKSLPSWEVVDELRLLSNTVKHSEIKDTRKLKQIRPELFRNTAYDAFDRFLDQEDIEAHRTEHLNKSVVLQPLAGSDLFVTEHLLQTYAEGVQSFFEQIATHLETQAAGDDFPG